MATMNRAAYDDLIAKFQAAFHDRIDSRKLVRAEEAANIAIILERLEKERDRL